MCSWAPHPSGHRQTSRSAARNGRVRAVRHDVELFVLAAAVPEVDNTSMAEFTQWAMDHVKSLRSGLPGARNAAMILPAPAGGSVQPAARTRAAEDARILGRS